MSRTIMVDTSGGIDQRTLDGVRADLKIGDLVACFDTMLHNVRLMTSEADIADYQFMGGGGTFFEPVVEFANDSGNPCVIYGDMGFCDADFDGLLCDLPTDLYTFVAFGNIMEDRVEAIIKRGFTVIRR